MGTRGTREKVGAGRGRKDVRTDDGWVRWGVRVRWAVGGSNGKRATHSLNAAEHNGYNLNFKLFFNSIETVGCSLPPFSGTFEYSNNHLCRGLCFLGHARPALWPRVQDPVSQ